MLYSGGLWLGDKSLAVGVERRCHCDRQLLPSLTTAPLVGRSRLTELVPKNERKQQFTKQVKEGVLGRFASGESRGRKFKSR